MPRGRGAAVQAAGHAGGRHPPNGRGGADGRGAGLMCGIAGIFDLSGRPVADAGLGTMNEAIRHRGPDDGGQYVEQGLGLANRRLAIIDLSPAGHQPMANEDGSLLLVYNGELYNFTELVPLLQSRGHTFHSKTDTEVILHAYEEWGPACLERMNGMFAFALWDQRRRELFLARDRFGIKPLYYALHDGRFVFASEIKSLLHAGIPRRVSPEALVEYFTFQNMLSDLTLFDGVRLLPAGHTLTVSDDGALSRRYWDLTFDPDDSVSEDEWAEQIRGTFEEVVTRQLVADVPVGSYLSGGMDSASIAAIASRNVPRLMTFTGGFDLSSVTGFELVFDERADAEVVASEFRTQHYEMVMHAGDMAWALPELVWHLEDMVSMAHSLEVRVPFLDNALVALAERIPARIKHGRGGGKELLRKAMAPLLPAEIVEKRKQGFSPPDQSWYRGPTMDYLREILLDPRSLGRGYFQPSFVRRVLEEHLEGRVNHRLLIWSLLCFEWWNRLFMDGDAATALGPRSSTARAT